MTTAARPLRGPRRRAHRDRRRDQARLPQARPAVAPGRERGPGGGRALQGDQRGVPGPLGPGAPPDLRHVRRGRVGGGARRGAGGFAGFGDFGDIFDAFFGGAPARGVRRGRPAAGSDLRYDLRITFEEAIRGTEKEIEFPVLDRCTTCGGTGAKSGSARHLPAVRRPRRGPQRPQHDARPDDQRHRLSALSRRGQDRRRPLRRVRRRGPDATDEAPPRRRAPRHRRRPPGPARGRGRGRPARRARRQPVRRGRRHAPSARSARGDGALLRAGPVDGAGRARRAGRGPDRRRRRGRRREGRDAAGLGDPAARARVLRTSAARRPRRPPRPRRREVPTKLSARQRELLEEFAAESGEVVGKGRTTGGFIDRIKDALG